MKESRIKFYVERSSFWTEAAMIFMGLAIVFRALGCWGLWDDRFYLITQVLLPIASGLLFIVLLALLGKSALWTTFLPVLGGVAFFVFKALTFEDATHMLLCLLLYAVVAIVYCGTVFTLIRTKWLLVPLFLLPFVYHVAVEDVARLRDTANPVTFNEGMQEISVLCIMLALLFTAFAMKKLVKDLKPEKTPAPVAEVKPAPQPVPAAPAAPEGPSQFERDFGLAPPPEDPPADETDGQ